MLFRSEVVGRPTDAREVIAHLVHAVDVELALPESGEGGLVVARKEALALREEHGRGGTEVGVARARDIKNRKNLSPDTVRRMHSFFARHAVDKQGKGWKAGEEGYPSAGLIAHLLWGGDSGASWAESKTNALDRKEGKSVNQRTEPSHQVTEGDDKAVIAYIVLIVKGYLMIINIDRRDGSLFEVNGGIGEQFAERGGNFPGLQF